MSTFSGLFTFGSQVSCVTSDSFRGKEVQLAFEHHEGQGHQLHTAENLCMNYSQPTIYTAPLETILHSQIS